VNKIEQFFKKIRLILTECKVYVTSCILFQYKRIFVNIGYFIIEILSLLLMIIKNSTMTSAYHIGLLFLRIAFSGMMLTHGIPKLMKLVEGNLGFGDPIGIGAVPSFILTVIAEAICPLLVIIGYKTRFASIPIIITMGVAAFIVHGTDPMGTKEKALLYLFAFIAIVLLGPGKHSVDKK
jgi:putative oxidoreductase